MQSHKSSRLIANTLPHRPREFSPVLRTLDGAAPCPKGAGREAEPQDPYRITDRAIDHVVDRLLEELTW